MNRIKFFTGPVMSGKTKLMLDFIDLLHPSEYVIVVPSMLFNDNYTIKSRSKGYPEYKPIFADDKANLYDLSKMENLRAVFCDEIHLFTHCQIDQLYKLVTSTNIKVYCFGLNIDYRMEVWYAVEYLKGKKCITQELSIRCKFCTESAICNIKYNEITDTEKLENDQEESLPCCVNCWLVIYKRSESEKSLIKQN